MSRATSMALLLAATTLAPAADFDVIWREIAHLRTSSPGRPPIVRRTSASPPANVSSGVRVEQLLVEPSVVSAGVGERFCVSQLDIAAFNPKGERVASVPLIVEMQQEHLRQLSLGPQSNDVCFGAKRAGEYAIRFSSELSATDGTFRGAQVFVRVAP
jgi:hypothetical protein